MQVFYFYLRGDYRWWWKSFFIAGSVAFYIFGYSLYFYSTTNINRLSSIILYFGYMILLSFTLFLISGSIGFLVTFIFLRKIYSMIKLD